MKTRIIMTTLSIWLMCACVSAPNAQLTHTPRPYLTETPPPTPVLIHTCDLLETDMLPELEWAKVKDAADLKEWIAAQLQFRDTAVTVTDEHNGTYGVDWSTTRVDFIGFIGVNGVKRIAVRWRGSRPNLSLVLSCFGDPGEYTAELLDDPRLGKYVGGDIWYPARGLVFWLWGMNGQITPTGSIPIFEAILVPPNDARKMIHDAFPETISPGTADIRAKMLKSWPGSINDIELNQR
jgi:hypothetical protein